MPHPLLIFSQPDYLIWIVAINSRTLWQIVQIQISWLLQKPTDLDLHCLQRQGISGFSRAKVKAYVVDAHQDFAEKPYVSTMYAFCGEIRHYENMPIQMY